MEIISSIYWNASREIFSLGPLSIRWYGLLFALGFVVGYQIMQWVYKRENKTQKQLDSLAITMILSTVIGARLGHCLFYEPQIYLSDPISILKVWEGGLASHGAAIGIIFGLWLHIRKQKDISLIWILDRIVIVVALAGFFIRLGNFFNSEIYGTPADLPWAVVFAQIDDIPRHPVQIYESLSYLLIFLFLFFAYKINYQKLKDGFLFGFFLILVFGVRFILEYFKSNQTDLEMDLPLKMGQILSIPFIIAGFYFLFKKFIKK
mgnify:CR=1 FL=1